MAITGNIAILRTFTQKRLHSGMEMVEAEASAGRGRSLQVRCGLVASPKTGPNQNPQNALSLLTQ